METGCQDWALTEWLTNKSVCVWKKDEVKDEYYTFSMNSEQVMTIALCDFGTNSFSSGIQIVIIVKYMKCESFPVSIIIIIQFRSLPYFDVRCTVWLLFFCLL